MFLFRSLLELKVYKEKWCKKYFHTFQKVLIILMKICSKMGYTLTRRKWWACHFLLNSHSISNILWGCDILHYIILSKQKFVTVNYCHFLQLNKNFKQPIQILYVKFYVLLPWIFCKKLPKKFNVVSKLRICRSPN